MAGRIVVFGATGYTGRLTAEALVARGAKPVLAARSRDRVEALAKELGGLEFQVADVGDQRSVDALVGQGDVLIATVGPFTRWGRPAAEAAVRAGAHYLDSTGEPPFIRMIFEEFDAPARKAGSGMVTAFGYDWVPGNLAGCLAAREAGDAAVRVDTGYFMTGDASGGMSGGTRASAAGAMAEAGYAWRDGEIVTERSAKRLRSFAVNGRDRPAVSAGASDHFGIPRFAPHVREVNAYLGWFGPLSRPMQLMALGTSVATRAPGVKGLLDAGMRRFVKGSTGGPDAATRAKSGSHIVAIAYDAAGHALSEVHLTGANGYDFTAGILAWGAMRTAADGMLAAGALAPVEAFGLDALEAGVREAGLTRKD